MTGGLGATTGAGARAGIHHTGLSTRDLDGLSAFYQSHFGFRPVEEPVSWIQDREAIARLIGARSTTGRMTMLNCGNIYLEIFEFGDPEPIDDGPCRPWTLGYTHICLATQDIDADFERLRQLGMRFMQPRVTAVGRVRAIYGFDPDGNMIELIQTDDEHPFAFHRLSRR